MIRADILDAARACVTKDRASTYGNAEDSFALIARYWSAHLGHAVTATDVAAMMALLKLARIGANPSHRDSWVDLAGYAACGGEIAAQPTERDLRVAQLRGHGGCDDAPVSVRPPIQRDPGDEDDGKMAVEALATGLQAQVEAPGYPRQGKASEGLSVAISEGEA